MNDLLRAASGANKQLPRPCQSAPTEKSLTNYRAQTNYRTEAKAACGTFKKMQSDMIACQSTHIKDGRRTDLALNFQLRWKVAPRAPTFTFNDR
jgi:hypothetical protein